MAFVTVERFKKNSPSTTIAAPGISNSDTTIPVAELSVFYDATGLIKEGIVISRNNATETATEEIKITGASGTSGAGNLTGATRGVSAHGTNGAAAAWTAGTLISCQISSTLMNRIKDDLDEHESAKAPIASPTFTGMVTTPAIKITGGTPGVGKVLVSDADGDGAWTTPAPGTDFLVVQIFS